MKNFKFYLRSPYPGISMIGTGSNGRTISSVTPYLARNGSLFLRSLKAAKSSGESEGTDVTTPMLKVFCVNFGKMGKIDN